MMVKNDQLYNDEKGLTLVEVLASLVILSLIFVSIITILNQSAITNKASEEIIDATYVAQQEMEFIYKASTKNVDLATISTYSVQPNDGNWHVYHKQSDDSQYLLEIKEDSTEFPMVRILVNVYEKGDLTKSKSKAQMETLLKWGGENEATP